MKPEEKAGAAPWDRRWPPGQEVGPAEGQCVNCRSCELRWLVHHELAGYRLRCECGQWLDIPTISSHRSDEQRLLASLEGLEGMHSLQRHEGAAELPRPADDVLEELPAASPEGELYISERKVGAHEVVQAGTLSRADPASQRRWIDRSLIEITLMLLAILLPHVAIMLLVPSEDVLLFMPLSSLAGGLLVLCVGAFSRGYTFGAVRGFRAVFALEAVLVAAVAGLLALGYGEFLREILPIHGEDQLGLGALRRELGLAFALFVVALCPAIFEELAFRGLLQGRLSALYGRSPGLLLTAVFFALAHGAGLGLPFHFGLGLWLGWLRVRSGSVVPGMLLHFLYNGGLVFLET